MESPSSTLADLALLTLVVAHGTDADLDPRETRVLVQQLRDLGDDLDEVRSGSELSDLVEAAVAAYGELRVRGLDDVVHRLGQTLSPAQIARVHAILVRVADADGVVHTMERTFLRHLAHVWGLD